MYCSLQLFKEEISFKLFIVSVLKIVVLTEPKTPWKFDPNELFSK